MTQSDIEDPDFDELRSKSINLYLFGDPISHSKSPTLQNSSYKLLGIDWKYRLFESTDIAAFKKLLEDDNCVGSGVTMPNKVIYTEHVDFIDDGAKSLGAINTVYKRKRKSTGKNIYIGTNTDTIGVRDAFLYNCQEIVEESRGKPGLVYGGGGACRSAIYSLYSFLGCSKVYIINRYKHEVDAVRSAMKEGGFTGEIIHVSTPEMAQAVEQPGLIVCTVPDFPPSTSEEKVAKATLDVFIQQQKKGAVLEMCYHPKPETRLYNQFKSNQWVVISGIEAMIYQGLAQQMLWTGYSLEQLPVKQVIDIVYRELASE